MLRLCVLALIGFIVWAFVKHPVESREMFYVVCYTLENLYHSVVTPGGKMG